MNLYEDLSVEALEEEDRVLLEQALRYMKPEKFRLWLRGLVEVGQATGYGSVTAIVNNGKVRTIQVLKSFE